LKSDPAGVVSGVNSEPAAGAIWNNGRLVSERENDELPVLPLDAISFELALRTNRAIVVPAKVFDAERDSRHGLVIYESLLAAVEECDALLSNSGSSPFLNLAAVMFPELQRSLSSIAFKAFELDSVQGILPLDMTRLRESEPKPGSLIAPTYSWVTDPSLPHDFDDGRKSDLSIRSKIRQAADSIRSSLDRSSTRIVYNSPIAADLQAIRNGLAESFQQRSSWSFRRVNHRYGRVLSTPIHLEQERVIFDHVSVAANQLQELLSTSVVNIKILFELASSALLQRYSKPSIQIASPKADAMLTGSMLPMRNRILAAHARANGIPVLTVYHGEASGIYDEPATGYGENSFASPIVGFGDYGCSRATDGVYSQSLLKNNPVEWVPSHSKYSRHVEADIKPGPSRTGSQRVSVMYVPTALSGNERYGPFRDANDVSYLHWQIGLLRKLASVENWDVHWKQHRKGRVEADIPIQNVTVSKEEDFIDLLNDVDLFVFDYPSTAFTVAAATDRPILYFDIGLRRLFEEASKSIEGRSYYTRSDINDPESAWGEMCRALDGGKLKTNTYSEAFSSSSDKRSREEVIAELIAKSVQGEGESNN
jgi:hypothetical protein